jgi:hypothetical protein
MLSKNSKRMRRCVSLFFSSIFFSWQY